MRIQNKDPSTKQLKSMIKAACFSNEDVPDGVSESSHLLAVETRSGGQYSRISPDKESV